MPTGSRKPTEDEGASPPQFSLPGAPAPPPISPVDLRMRMGMMGGSADVAPVWGMAGGFEPAPYANPSPFPTSPFAPPPVPLASNAPRMPSPVASAPEESVAPSSPWAAANPLAASASGGEMFGAPIREGIFKQLYRAGRRSDNAALMAAGDPSRVESGEQEPGLPALPPPPDPRSAEPELTNAQRALANKPAPLQAPDLSRMGLGANDPRRQLPGRIGRRMSAQPTRPVPNNTRSRQSTPRSLIQRRRQGY